MHLVAAMGQAVLVDEGRVWHVIGQTPMDGIDGFLIVTPGTFGKLPQLTGDKWHVCSVEFFSKTGDKSVQFFLVHRGQLGF